MRMRLAGLAATVVAVVMAGCGTVYSWRPTVPADRRTISVPTFRNTAELPGFGSVMSRQLLRELQREGTFVIESVDDAALEVQGEVVSFTNGSVAFDRHGSRKSSYELTGKVRVTLVDRRGQKVLFDNRMYDATVTYSTGGDTLNAKRDASGRLADELSRRIVDDILNLKW